MKKTIVVSAVTRGRPEMFGTLLKSLKGLSTPFGIELLFCFVENDAALTIEERVEAFSRASGFQAVALCEARQGIPFSRNAALNWALNTNADFLAFIDDDEMATEDWVANLYAEIEARALDLVGGPVVPVVTNQKLTTVEALVLRGVRLRADKIARTNRQLKRVRSDQRVTIVTNNWLLRLNFLRREHVKFDEGLGFSGGSDAAFFRAAKKASAKTGWVPEAVVMEEIPKSRLTLGYQFTRGRDQAISSYRVRYQDTLSLKLLVSSIFFVISKALLGLLRITAALFNRGGSLVLALRAFGFAWGRILAVAGYKSRHYQTVHGS